MIKIKGAGEESDFAVHCSKKTVDIWLIHEGERPPPNTKTIQTRLHGVYIAYRVTKGKKNESTNNIRIVA